MLVRKHHIITSYNKIRGWNPLGAILCLFLVFCVTFCSNPNEDLTQSDTHKSLFTAVPSTSSNIHFSNTIVENFENGTNLLDFDYVYNGSGVGICDLDNDGLEDLVFCGNQAPNRVYKNKGGLEFEDMTESSGLEKNKKWSTGVSFADINGDGLKDIYICQGGPFGSRDRSNLLFINQGNFKFKESAAEYGLDDKSISTQSSFFDYDKDGDLDCVVINESTLFALVSPYQLFDLLNKNPEQLWFSTTHLYENRDGKFHDVTKEAGMLFPTYGLGLIINDINEDGWPDIYVANDYYLPDNLWINKGDGTFVDEVKQRTKQISYYGMGVDMGDLNNDGHAELFVLDMASDDHIRSKTLMPSMDTKRFNSLVNDIGFPYQYMFNSLQLNNGDGTFSNIVQASNMSSTDWSWAALINDFDNDGFNDIYVTNGYRRYALDNDIRSEIRKVTATYGAKGIPSNIKKELNDKMPSEKLSNILFHNQGDLTFEKMKSESGLDIPSFSNGAAYGDLDLDGDLDLVVNNINDEAFLFSKSNS